MPKQNYVSEDLMHFVGRSQPTPEAKYQLLLKIISEGQLRDISHDGKQYPILEARRHDKMTGRTQVVRFSSYPSVRHDPNASLADNQLLQFELVCFCDIPREHLAIHCTKYSDFGLSFLKQFLVAQGAGPVMYVPLPGEMIVRISGHEGDEGKLVFDEEKSVPREYLYDGLFGRHNQLGENRYQTLQEVVQAAANAGDESAHQRGFQQLQTMLIYQTAVEAYLFGFLKFFDPSLPEDHKDNYYMEREWRVAGKVKFSTSDISHVLLPVGFGDRMRADRPELADRIIELRVNVG